MTKSTGARARQKRREELLWGELMLRRALLHVMSSTAWACRARDEAERSALSDAYDILRAAHASVVNEQKKLRAEG